MDQTPRGYVYPECDPPLVKDASDIVQMKALAEAIDADFQGVVDRVNTELLQPDAIRLIGASVPTTAVVVDPAMVTVTFTNNPAMDGGVGALAPVTGWYLVGTYSVVTSASVVNARTRLLKNGAPITPYSDQAGIYAGGNAQFTSLTATLFLNAGDEIHVRLERVAAGTPTWTYQARLWMLKLMAV